MMGLGYLGSSAASSSSSSSNLSPLAPPFTVDRSNQHNKPVVNSNSIPHLNGVPFTSSWPYSQSSSSARHSFMADSPRTTTTTTLPSNDSGYMIPETQAENWGNGGNKHGLEQITPPPGPGRGRSHWSAVYPNPSPKRVTDSFSYNLSEAKPFYPPYAAAAASSVKNVDDNPLVTFSEPNYDLLSHADETSKDEYTRSLSGLEYNYNHHHHHQQQQQDSVWNGLPDEKQLKKIMDTDYIFDANLAASLAYNSYLNQGAYGTETSRKSKDDPSLFYYADIIRRANNTGPSTNGKSDANNHRLDPNDLSKGGSTFRAFPMFSESHPLIHSSETPEDLWNSQNSYNPYEKRYHMFDCSDDHMPASVSKSPTLVIKPPPAASTFSAKTISSKSLEIGNLSSLNINDVVGSHKPLKEKEQASGSFLAPNQLSFQIGRTNERTFVAPPSSTKEDVSMSTKLSANDQLNFEFKARPGFQVPEISLPNVNTIENVKITANSFEQFDNYNPAEDSPCWKGAPTSQFLPFEAESPQPPMKKLQTGNGVDLQTDSSFKISSGVHKIGETDPIPITKEHTVELVDVGVNSSKASNGGVYSVHDTIKPMKEHGSLNESTSDANSQTPKLKLPTPEMDNISPEMKIQLLYGDVATAKNVNASGLVNSLYNLSDLLLLHCSNDEFALKEHDRETLDHVIHNLGVCMSREVQVASTHKSMMLQQKTSQEGAYGILHDDQTGESDARYQKQNSDMFGKNVEKLLEHASLRVEADPPKDHNMVQAIKKVLDDNVECKVELPSETLLYKNLWLEAEAELCSSSFRARFERLKRETKKGKPDKLKARDAASASGASIKEISSCDDPKIISKPIPKDDGSEVPIRYRARFNSRMSRVEPNPVDVKVAGVKVSGKGSQGPEVTLVGKEKAVDIDPWVMDRLNILKRRGELNANDVEEKEVRDCGKEGPMGGHFQDEEEEEEEAVGSGGSDWEHILKDDFSWRLS